MKTIFLSVTLSALVLTSDVSANGTEGGCVCGGSQAGGPLATNPAYQQDCFSCCIGEWNCVSECSNLFGTPSGCSSSSSDKENAKDKRVERHKEVANESRDANGNASE